MTYKMPSLFSYLVLCLSACVSFGNALKETDAGSLRAAVAAKSWNPPDAQVIVNVNSPGASIESTQGGFSRTVGTTLCNNFGSNSQTAEMKFDVNFPLMPGQMNSKQLPFNCPFKFDFPNAKSGSCECTISFMCIQGFWGWSDWECGAGFKFDCGTNVCATVNGGTPGTWNANEMKVNHVTINPINPENPNESPPYAGPATARWIQAGSGGTVQIMQSSTFSSSTAKKNAETNSLTLSMGKISFMGAELGASATSTVTNEITNTITSTAVSSKTCTSVSCSTTTWQGQYTLTTKDGKNSIVVNSCMFQCSATMPTCAPGAC